MHTSMGSVGMVHYTIDDAIRAFLKAVNDFYAKPSARSPFLVLGVEIGAAVATSSHAWHVLT